MTGFNPSWGLAHWKRSSRVFDDSFETSKRFLPTVSVFDIQRASSCFWGFSRWSSADGINCVGSRIPGSGSSTDLDDFLQTRWNFHWRLLAERYDICGDGFFLSPCVYLCVCVCVWEFSIKPDRSDARRWKKKINVAAPAVSTLKRNNKEKRKRGRGGGGIKGTFPKIHLFWWCEASLTPIGLIPIWTNPNWTWTIS